jgi:membrane protein DedA with SNARE-associated domain
MKKIILLIAFVASSILSAEAQVVNDSTLATGNEESLITKVENWYASHMNYATITILMTIESSFIPFPSEIVIPPAAYVAEDPNSDLHIAESYPVNVLLIVLFGTLGAMLGAIINYLLAMWLGRPIIYAFADSKLGHLCLLSGEKVKKAEDYFNDHGKVSTFVGRLIPGIRQLISIPAGLCKMHFGWFLFYTFLGAGIWNTVLALLGYITRGQKELIDTYSHELSIAIMALLALVVAYYIIKAIIKRVKKS